MMGGGKNSFSPTLPLVELSSLLVQTELNQETNVQLLRVFESLTYLRCQFSLLTTGILLNPWQSQIWNMFSTSKGREPTKRITDDYKKSAHGQPRVHLNDYDDDDEDDDDDDDEDFDDDDNDDDGDNY